jgi:DNA replication and repair protein RecF
MGFESIRFFNFRNLNDDVLPLGAAEIFLIGENGQGKTNLIEAVNLLCVGSSFRENHELPLFRNPDIAMALHGRYREPSSTEKAISLEISPGKNKEIRIDGKQAVDRRDLFEQTLCICFVQQDMQFVEGPPEERRRFFDQTLVLSNLSILSVLREYRHVLKARNFALKSRQADILDAYDRQMANLGIEIMKRRASLIGEFNAMFVPLLQTIMEPERALEIRYFPSWRDLSSPDEAMDHLGSTRGKDLAMGSSTSGPHRDVFLYSMGGRNFVPFASTGQIRLCALVLRVTQTRYLAERTKRKPVLLLDDVLLELDPAKKKAFLSLLPPSEQVFFTFLPDESYLSYRREDTLVLHVEKGEFRR